MNILNKFAWQFSATIHEESNLKFVWLITRLSVISKRDMQTLPANIEWQTNQQSLYLFIRNLFLFIHLFSYSSSPLFLSLKHPFIHASIHSFIHSSIHPSIHSFIHSFIHSSIHPFIHSSIHPSIHPSIHSIHSFIHSSIHSSIHSFIHSFIYALHD